MRETDWEKRQSHRQREKRAPCREPDVGLDPGLQGNLFGFFFVLYLYIYFLKIYLFIHERHRLRGETETQAEGEAGFSQGARCGTRSRIRGSRPEPKAGAQPLSHPGVPLCLFLKVNKIVSARRHTNSCAVCGLFCTAPADLNGSRARTIVWLADPKLLLSGPLEESSPATPSL